MRDLGGADSGEESPFEPGPTAPYVERPVRVAGPHTTLRDSVADEIRRRVFAAQILPGQRVDQDGLARELGVSRVPVREALIALHEEGIIENVAHRGAFVAELCRDDVLDHYRLLGMVSGLAAERAAGWMTPSDRRELEDLLARMESVFAEGSAAEAERLNFRFHQRIHRLARSRRLISVLGTLARTIPTEFYETHSQWPAKAHQDHVRIAGALAAGDGQRARLETEWHFTDGGARAVDYLERLGFWSDRAT